MMAIITHYLELIRDYILRMKQFTNMEFEKSNNKDGKYLDTDNDESISSGNGSGSYSDSSSDDVNSPKKNDENQEEAKTSQDSQRSSKISEHSYGDKHPWQIKNEESKIHVT
jgi:hypothetical protein